MLKWSNMASKLVQCLLMKRHTFYCRYSTTQDGHTHKMWFSDAKQFWLDATSDKLTSFDALIVTKKFHSCNSVRWQICVQGVLDKFSQIQPSLLFSVNAVVYNGKVHSHLDKLKQVVEGEFAIYTVTQQKPHIFEIPYFWSHDRYSRTSFTEVFRNHNINENTREYFNRDRNILCKLVEVLYFRNVTANKSNSVYADDVSYMAQYISHYFAKYI